MNNKARAEKLLAQMKSFSNDILECIDTRKAEREKLYEEYKGWKDKASKEFFDNFPTPNYNNKYEIEEYKVKIKLLYFVSPVRNNLIKFHNYCVKIHDIVLETTDMNEKKDICKLWDESLKLYDDVSTIMKNFYAID